jgi:conjugative transposon TraM protein
MDKKTKDKVLKYFLFSGIALMLIIFIWVMVANSKKKKREQTAVISKVNKDLPMAEDDKLLSKQQAYELEDYTGLNYSWNADAAEEVDMTLIRDSLATSKSRNRQSPSPSDATKALENTLLSLGEQVKVKQSAPQVDTAQARLQRENEQRREDEKRREQERLEEIQQQQNQVQQLLLAQMQAQQGTQTQALSQQPDENEPNERTAVYPLEKTGDGIVSNLKRGSFNGLSSEKQRRTTIKATVYGKHIITSGQNVRFRLREPMQVGNTIVPAGTIVIGTATIGVDRVLVTINSIENETFIISVRMDVYDLDGAAGMFVPGSMENEAAKEIAQDVTNSIGSNATQGNSYINNQSAAEMVKTDITKGLIQGTTRYIGRKLGQIKVTIQDGHQVYLISKSN